MDSGGQVLPEKPFPVAVKDVVDVRVAVTAIGQNAGQLLKVAVRLQIARGLLIAKTAIEVCTEGGVLGVAGDVTDAVDMVGQRAQVDDVGLSHSALPVRVKHPRIQRCANDAA